MFVVKKICLEIVFSCFQNTMELEKYDLIELIGVGSYGQVFKGRIKETGDDIAVKLINKVGLRYAEGKFSIF